MKGGVFGNFNVAVMMNIIMFTEQPWVISMGYFDGTLWSPEGYTRLKSQPVRRLINQSTILEFHEVLRKFIISACSQANQTNPQYLNFMKYCTTFNFSLFASSSNYSPQYLDIMKYSIEINKVFNGSRTPFKIQHFKTSMATFTSFYKRSKLKRPAEA